MPQAKKSVFLDISKAIEKVWHQGVTLKLKLNSISGTLLKIIEEFYSNRWATVKAGVSQGSIPGPFLSLAYINNLSTGLL